MRFSILMVFMVTLCSAQQSPWRRASGTEGKSISSLDIYRGNPDTLYAIGTNISGFMRSIDRGEHWESIGANGIYGPGPIRADPKDSRVIYASIAGIGSGNDIVMTTNGGQDWQHLFTGGFNFRNVIEIDPMDHRTVYAGLGMNIILRTINQGQTWGMVTPPPGTWLSSLAIATTNDSILYAGYLIPGLYKSTDRGSNWIQMPFVSQIMSPPRLIVDPRDANTIYAAIDAADTSRPCGVFKSTDGGFTWVEKNGGLRKQDRKRISAIVLNPKNPDDLFLGVSNESGSIIFRSINAGEQWFGFSDGLPRLGSISSIAIDTANNRAYAAGGQYPDSLGIFILDDLTTDVVQRTHEIPQEVYLCQNYPNPFNPSTKIGYGVRSPESISLRVYDILGRDVATLVNEVKQPGSYELTWDGSGCVSGIYFYRLQTLTARITQKMLLVR